MRHHIALKFLAVLLCALTLLGSFACVVGIILMEEKGVYESDIPTLQKENQQQILSYAAKNVLRQYAHTNLSNCPETLIEQYYGLTLYTDDLAKGSWFYTIADADGIVLESNLPANNSGLLSMAFPDLSTWYSELVEGPVKSEQYTGEHSRDPMLTPTEPDSLDPARPDAGGVYGFIYWDDEVDGYMEAKLRDIHTEGYTVTIHYTYTSFTNLNYWQLLKFAWQNRFSVIGLLIVCLLLFAVGAVYLCCAAGRKPESDEVKAGGLNALPLDLYTAVDLFLALLTWHLLDELNYAISSTPLVFFTFLILGCFFLCLLFVGYCFAWAAQLKEGGGRWWQGSVIALCCRVGWWLVKSFFTLLLPLITNNILRVITKLFEIARKIITVTFVTFRDAVLWVRNKVVAGFWWVGSKVERVFSLLPVTWQWILVGFGLVAILFLGIVNAMNRYDPFGLLVCIGICLAVVLYGAHAFGLLLEAVKKMRQGDLDNQVSDRLLLGAFEEFAEELNGLAGVAKVAAQKEMKSERMKTELITNVSHDIKTPLTSIINYVDLLQKPHTPEEETEYLEVLGRKSQQLKKLIQDLMEMSKASTGNMTAELRRMDAVEAVNQALGEYADKLAAAELTPVVNAPEAAAWVLADGRLTWRVLSNLLSNAVKYALAGTRLYVDVAEKADHVLISVKNVSAQALNVDAEELMERFVRGDAARNSEGSGLGLNIAKSLMEVQNGQLVLTVDGDLFKATLILPKA